MSCYPGFSTLLADGETRDENASIAKYTNQGEIWQVVLSEARILSELRNIEASVICDRGTDAEYLIPAKERIQLYPAVGQTLQRQTVLFKPGTAS